MTASGPRNGTRTVLVVEDEPAIRGLLSLTLEAEGYHVATAQDGHEALSRIRDQQPDAIVLDLLLPDLDGWTFIRSLEQDGKRKQTPIIAVSAGVKRAIVGEHGVKAFLSKPFDLETLLVVLDDVLRDGMPGDGVPQSSPTH
jgi:DNA-binding response OmpR family regulator